MAYYALEHIINLVYDSSVTVVNTGYLPLEHLINLVYDATNQVLVLDASETGLKVDAS